MRLLCGVFVILFCCPNTFCQKVDLSNFKEFFGDNTMEDKLEHKVKNNLIRDFDIMMTDSVIIKKSRFVEDMNVFHGSFGANYHNTTFSYFRFKFSNGPDFFYEVNTNQEILYVGQKPSSNFFNYLISELFLLNINDGNVGNVFVFVKYTGEIKERKIYWSPCISPGNPYFNVIESYFDFIKYYEEDR